MEHILSNFIKDLFQTFRIPARIIHPPLDECGWMDRELRSRILGISDVNGHVNQMLSNLKPNTLYFITDKFQCNYIYVLLPDSGDCLFCGPVIFEKMIDSRFDDLFRKLNLPEKLSEPLRNYYYDIPLHHSEADFRVLFILCANYWFGEGNYEIVNYDSIDLDNWQQYYENYYRIPDHPLQSVRFIEERYQIENSILDAVSNGNFEKASNQFASFLNLLIPARLQNELRDHMDYCITMNTLLRKAAEQGGVHPIHIDSYSKSNIQQIEKLSSIEQCKSLGLKLIRGYCRLVQKYNLKNYSLLTQKVITYVNSDLQADLSLKALSERLSVNSSYLSTLFRKEMDISLTEYVNNHRISHAKKLLMNTDLPIKTVARSVVCPIPITSAVYSNESPALLQPAIGNPFTKSSNDED